MSSRWDKKIRDYCIVRSMTFNRPWQFRPWDVNDGPSPYRTAGAVGIASWSVAQELRRQIIAELKHEKNHD